ncbi:MAG: hypothetical protein H3Z53_12540 [archaeon]|nr:hypothetical protein [archaeon]
MLDYLIDAIACASIGIAIIAPFLTVLLLSRRIERISGVRSYWHLFLFSIIFYVIHLLVEWSNILGNLTLEPLILLLYITAPLMLSALSTAFGMMGLMSTIDYSTGRIFLAFTSVGVAVPIILGLGLNYIATPLLPLPIAILTLLQGFLMFCYISLSYFLLSRFRSILGEMRIPFALIASAISLSEGFGFLYFSGSSISGFSPFDPYITMMLGAPVYAVVGLMASYSSFRLAKGTKPLPLVPLEGKLETGIREIDDLLKGGIPHPSSILLLGVVGSGKTGIFLRLSHYRLEKGDSVIFVCTNNIPENYRSMMKAEGFEPKPFEERNSLIFIDAYANKFGLESEEKYSTSIIPYDINVAISEAIDEAKGIKKIIIVHSLTDILDECGARDGLMFLKSLVAKTREAKATLLLSLNPQAFPPAVLALAQESVDSTIELKEKKAGVRLHL